MAAEQIETVIIGGGQAGLALSYYLAQQARPHVILEQAPHLAHAWRTQRWDSFTLVTPNWQLCLPGFAYAGAAPDGFLTKDEVVAYLESYAARIAAPIRFGVLATAVEPAGGGYRVTTNTGDLSAANVVVATGLFQQPKRPAWSAALSPTITQIHSGEYRNPSMLPPGAVLVAGSAQSGCQLAEELYQSGRKVYLSVGSSSGRVPRRYRGKDCVWWLDQMGFYARTVEQLPSPKAKFAGNPHTSGRDGGRTLNVHQFARDGVTLLGRLIGGQDDTLVLAADLHENLAKIDRFEAELVQRIDSFIVQNGLDAPVESLPQLRDGYATPLITELNLVKAGITTVIWAMGYTFDFSWVRLPVLDEDGFPVQQRGVTAYPGLYFLGLPWLHTIKSGLLYGVGEDAAHIAAHMTQRDPSDEHA